MMANSPRWLETAVFYEIYPQSFCDTNADGIGDINGIIKKLDYINALGCNAIWLNPCFKSPFNDAGYDVEDYYTIASRYGTNEDMVTLFNEAHKRDMHVLLDLVPGHTSYKHKWFTESIKAEKNEYSDRYIWTDSVWNAPSYAQWLRGISDRDGSVMLNFFSTQPALNYGFLTPTESWQQPMDAPAPKKTKQAMKDVMCFWLGLGCDGFRVDMAGSLVKNDNENSDGTVSLWREFRELLDSKYPNAALISEWGEPNKSLAGGFHMDFLLHFGPSHYNDLFRTEHPYFSESGKGTAKDFIATYKENMAKTDGKGLICIPSGNHDMDRLARHLDETQIKLAFAFLLTMPGAPFIYYGDEIGMRYVEGLDSVEGGFGRTGSRSPMQWDDSTNAGFSSAREDMLYIPLDSDINRPNAKAQMSDKSSIYHVVKELIALRKSHTSLCSSGEIEFITNGDYPLCYTRKSGDEEMIVVINPMNEEKSVEINKTLELVYAVGDSTKALEKTVLIPPKSAQIFIAR